MILSSRDFVAGFTPPDYVVDGILMRRFFYSLTALTGAGKTAVLLYLARAVATGSAFAGHYTEKGRVIYFAGENPDDVRMRWISMASTSASTSTR